MDKCVTYTGQVASQVHASSRSEFPAEKAICPEGHSTSIMSSYLRPHLRVGVDDLPSVAESHYQRLWNSVPFGIAIIDRLHRIVDANDPLARWLGWDSIASEPIELPARVRFEDRDRLHQFLQAAFSEQTIGSLEVQVECLEGPAIQGAQLGEAVERRPVVRLRLTVSSASAETIALSVEDVTLLHEISQQMRQNAMRLEQLQRLELVHTISAGIAHDFKNIVQVIESYAAILNGQLLAIDQDNTIPLEIMTAASRGAMLANRWLAYTRYGQLQKQQVELNQFTLNCMERIEQAMPPAICMELRSASEATTCMLDPCLMEQVFCNLCWNARDAMPRGGVLSISVDKVVIDPQTNHDLLLPGTYARFRVADDGAGISSENLKRIFEPFFTTKETCSGTGLGLALVRSIILEHQGAIEVWSEPGCGSQFTFYLPLGETCV